ncbi:MAG TPA: pseudouridine synthase [Candidatus Saccharimonadales bacterium]|nr:pseudouridine synthase [Candidatus Saccharimonadales bacterium]
MRLNKYIAQATGLSRRAADEAIAQNRVRVNGQLPSAGQQVSHDDQVTLDGVTIAPAAGSTTIMLNKPAGYVSSREGQGSRTIYDLLPAELHSLKPVGRLDKDSSGLLLLTDDGQLAHQLTHPSFQKTKIYEVQLDKPLQPLHRQLISDYGVTLEDGRSQLSLERLTEGDDTQWQVTMHEGRNRQIRRTFGSLGYDVVRLHRTQFGAYRLDSLKPGTYRTE